jgi:hypothetical protein
VELATWQEADAELEVLQTSTARVWDLLGSVDGSSSLAASMSVVAELLEGWINAAPANGVRWGSHSMLVATVSQFLVLRSGCNVDLTKDKVDALWTRVCMASDLLASHVASSAARNPPDGMGE